MAAAAKEKADGKPTEPTNEHERIVSEWIAPVSRIPASSQRVHCLS